VTVSLLALQDANDWTAATVDWDAGGGAVTFTPSSAVRDALGWTFECLQFLVDEGDPGPSWSFAADGAGGAVITITTTNSWSAVVSATAQSYMGWSGVYASGTTFAGSSSAATTFAPAMALSWGAYRRGMRWEAQAAAAGAMGGDALAVGVRRPVMQGAGSPAEAFRLAELALVARHPRTALVWDGSVVISVSVGQITREPARPLVYRLRLEVLA